MYRWNFFKFVFLCFSVSSFLCSSTMSDPAVPAQQQQHQVERGAEDEDRQEAEASGEEGSDYDGEAGAENKNVLDYSIPRHYEIQQDRTLPLESLVFDETATSGQIRVVVASDVEGIYRSFKNNPPTVPCRIVVW